MNNLEASFFRKFPIEVLLKGRTSFFYLTVGFKNLIDSESGMSINMTVVDSWIQECLQFILILDFEHNEDILNEIEKFLLLRGPLVSLELLDPLRNLYWTKKNSIISQYWIEEIWVQFADTDREHLYWVKTESQIRQKKWIATDFLNLMKELSVLEGFLSISSVGFSNETITASIHL